MTPFINDAYFMTGKAAINWKVILSQSQLVGIFENNAMNNLGLYNSELWLLQYSCVVEYEMYWLRV